MKDFLCISESGKAQARGPLRGGCGAQELESVAPIKDYERKVGISRKFAATIDQELFLYDYPRSAQQRQDAFELRYKVFCEECGFIPQELFPDGKETDAYDGLSSTRMFVVLDPRTYETIGVVRAIRDPLNPHFNPSGAESGAVNKLPMERHFSLDEFRNQGRNIEQVSSLAVSRCRGKKVPFGLFKSIYLDAIDHGIDDIFIQANPVVAWLFEGIGFRKLYECWHALLEESPVPTNKKVPVYGMHLDMSKIHGDFIDYFNRPSSCFLFRGKPYAFHN